jgi:hypothetical protein
MPGEKGNNMEIQKISVEEEVTINMGNYQSIKIRHGAEATGGLKDIQDLHLAVENQLYNSLEASVKRFNEEVI